MTTFSINEPEYYINDNQCAEDKFVPECLKQIRELVSVSDKVDCKSSDRVNDSFSLNKSSGFRSFRNIENLLNDAVSELYERYDLITKDNVVEVTALSDDEQINILIATGTAVERTVSDVTSSKVEIGDVADVDVNIPVLTNKAYNSFINLCNETQQFLVDYAEIGQKTAWLLKKTDVNAIAKAIFSPIRSWDYVGDVCKMKKEEFELIKSNLVQYSVDNACVRLNSYSWNDVFAWIKERKSNCIKFTESSDSFVAKIKTNVIDSKKFKIGTIIVTISIVVDQSITIPELTKGRLQVHPSNISFNMIAR